MKEIKDAFDKLHYAFDSSNVNWADRLFEQCRQEEKEHRGFMPNFKECHTSDTAILNDVARMFAVHRVAECLVENPRLPELRNYLHTQKSCFMAAAIALEYRDKILSEKCWNGTDIIKYAALDYCHYVKPARIEPEPTTHEYQPKTGAKCWCRSGIERDNCPNCEGTGEIIDFAKIRAR